MGNNLIEEFIQRMIKRKLLFDLPPTERDYDDLIIDLKEAGFIDVEGNIWAIR